MHADKYPCKMILHEDNIKYRKALEADLSSSAVFRKIHRPRRLRLSLCRNKLNNSQQ